MGKTPKEIFDRARAKGRGSKGGGALGVLMQDVLIQGDYVHLMMNGAGKATITAKYQDGGVTKEGSITVTVEPVQFEINPANATYEVGEEATFYAAIKNAKSRNLPNGVSQWSAKPEGIVSIAPIQPDPTSMFLTRMVW